MFWRHLPIADHGRKSCSSFHASTGHERGLFLLLGRESTSFVSCVLECASPRRLSSCHGSSFFVTQPSLRRILTNHLT